MSSQEDSNSYDVVIIGAGISGINFAYRLQQRNPELSYTILEGRDAIGGTWSLFKYPGLRSDTSLYTFGFSWRPWKEDTSIAKAHLINKYLKESAQENGIDKHIQCKHHVNAASWSSKRKAWTLAVSANGIEQTYQCKFMIMSTGYYDYNEALNTVIPGIENFQGPVVHPQFWPEELDYTNKDLVIIGSGATAITLLPALADKAAHVTMLQRSPSYILSVLPQDGLEKFIRRWFSPVMQDRLLWLKWLLLPFFFVKVFYYFPSFARNFMRKQTMAQLPPEIAYDPHFTPRYEVGEQRLCFSPDSDFFKALRSGRGGIETGVIESVTTNVIKLESGRELCPDIIITATGLKLQIAGRIKLTVDSAPYDLSTKFVWKGAMLEDLPNAAFVLGYADAAWTLGADATAQLITRILKQMRRDNVVEVRPYRTEAEKKHMLERPLLSLSSTYITKGSKALPRASDRGQWAVRSYYIKDMLMAWYGDIKTGMIWVREA